MRRKPNRLLVGAATMLVALASIGLGTAAAAEPAPFGHACTPENGVRFCPAKTAAERVPSFDGVPIDVDVTLPETGTGPFPTIVMMHGFGGSKTDFETSTPEGPAPLEAGNGSTIYHYNNVYPWWRQLSEPRPRAVPGWTRIAEQAISPGRRPHRLGRGPRRPSHDGRTLRLRPLDPADPGGPAPSRRLGRICRSAPWRP